MALAALLRVLDPFGIVRNYIVQPFVDFLCALYVHYRERTVTQVDNLRDILVRLGVVLFVVACVSWTAIFMYVTFYYVYMPQIAHMRPVHMQYK